jgi:nicotinamide riboside kinase
MENKGKLISIMGPPCSGKSTLATEVHTELKKRNLNSILVSEVATEFISEYGIPNSPIDQMTIFYKQLNKEKMFIDTKDYIICDSSSILNYFYFRGLFPSKISNKNIAIINNIQKEILKSINQWDYIFYVQPMEILDVKDGIRFHEKEEISKIDRWIKSYLEIENIDHIDLSNIPLEKRSNKILEHFI